MDMVRKLKRISYVILLIIISLIVVHVQAMTKIETNIESNYGILYDVTDDMVLFDKGSNERIKIASMTKIMTAIVALEHINNLDDTVVITQDDYKNVFKENLTVLGFEIGKTVSYRDLLYGLLFRSGADCAYALADNVAGSEENFVQMMNDKAKELNLKNTKFTNSVGYDEDNYSSVYDTVLFFKYALENDTFKKIISNKNYTTSDNKFTLQNVVDEQIDKVGVESNYNEYILGGKTGYTKEAKNCLASYAVFKDTTYIVVVANASTYNPIKDTVNLYTAAFDNYSRKKVFNQDDYLISLSYKQDEVKVYAEDEVDVLLPNEANLQDVSIEYKGRNITSNLKLDEKLGSVNVNYDGETLKKIDIKFNSKIKNSLHYGIVKPSSKSNSCGKIFVVAITSFGGIIVLFIMMIFISMCVDVKKKRRKWKF